jgi:hypothetical protein
MERPGRPTSKTPAGAMLEALDATKARRLVRPR